MNNINILIIRMLPKRSTFLNDLYFLTNVFLQVSYQMLLDWIQMKADEAILGELMSIMWHLGEKLLVREISKISSIR